MTRQLLLALFLASAVLRGTTFHVNGAGAQPWLKILGAVGITRGEMTDAAIVIGGPAAMAENHLLILEGISPAARSFGITAKTDTVRVRQIRDTHAPGMQIFWEQPAELAVTELPADFQVFATERWKGAPVMAGKRTAHGAVLWIATSPGASGIERYPYLVQALVDLGLDLRLSTTNLWAFFDSSYRISRRCRLPRPPLAANRHQRPPRRRLA